MVSLSEAAEVVGIHPETLRRLVKQGVVPASRIGKSWRVRLSDLEPSLHGPGAVAAPPKDRTPEGRFAAIAAELIGWPGRTRG